MLPDRLVAGPERELVDLVRELVEVLADELDERRNRIGLRPDAGLLEALRNPRVGLPLRNVVGEHVACLRAGFRQRCVLLQLLGDERQHGARRGRGQVLLDRLHVGGLPAVSEPALAVAPPVHAFDEHEPRVAEEAAGVAEGGDLATRLLLCADDLRRLGLEVAAKPPERRFDLGPVAAGEQIDRLERGRVGHDASLLNAPNAPRSAGRPTRARRDRPRRCGTGAARAVAERSQRGRRRMAVFVVAAAGDDRHGRPQLAQFIREPGIGRAVVGDLQNLDAARQQRRGHVRLGVGGQQRIDLAEAREQHDRERFGSSPAVPALSARATRSRSRPSRKPSPARVRRPARRALPPRRARHARTGPRRKPGIEHAVYREPSSMSSAPPTWSAAGA